MAAVSAAARAPVQHPVSSWSGTDKLLYRVNLGTNTKLYTVLSKPDGTVYERLDRIITADGAVYGVFERVVAKIDSKQPWKLSQCKVLLLPSERIISVISAGAEEKEAAAAAGAGASKPPVQLPPAQQPEASSLAAVAALPNITSVAEKWLKAHRFTPSKHTFADTRCKRPLNAQVWEIPLGVCYFAQERKYMSLKESGSKLQALLRTAPDQFKGKMENTHFYNVRVSKNPAHSFNVWYGYVWVDLSVLK